MKLEKRDCGIKMELIPYGAGWTDVRLDICGDSHLFIISYSSEDLFNALLDALFYLYPDNNDPERGEYSAVEYKEVTAEIVDGKRITRVLDEDETDNFNSYSVPWRASFWWDDDREGSRWTLERDFTEDTDFVLKINVMHKDRDYHYKVRFADFCYAVTKACTAALKKHGFCGYREATYNQDINIRQLLFLKSVALNDFEAVRTIYYQEKGKGETSDFSEELELLLFDM